MNKIKISLILPVKNEEENLKSFLPTIPINKFYEIILIDGVSSDNSIKIAKEWNENIIILHQKTKGKGGAMIEAASQAKGDYLIYIDSDGSMDISEVDKIIKKFQEGYELVKGSRNYLDGYSKDITWFRNFGNNFFTSLTNFLYRTKFTDLCYGYFGIYKDRMLELDLEEHSFGIETEIVVKSINNKLKISEFPSIENERLFGVSNLNAFIDGWSILLTIIKNKIKK